MRADLCNDPFMEGMDLYIDQEGHAFEVGLLL